MSDPLQQPHPLQEDKDFEGAEQGLEDEGVLDLAANLTDAAKYAYAGLCATGLHKLFDTVWDRPFNEACLKCVLRHLQLPKQVEPIMFLLLSGEIQNSVDSFVHMLRAEPCLHGNLKCVVQDLIAVAVQEGEYDARWRVLIRFMSQLTGAQFEEMELYEITVVHCLTRDSKVPSEEEQKAIKSRERLVKAKRYAMIGLATIGGGALIGISAGLVAPAILGGLGSVLGASTAGALAGTAGAAVVGTMFGAAGAGLTGYKMNKRVGGIDEFAFGQLFPPAPGQPGDRLTHVTTPQLDITIAISGWIKDDDSEETFTRPWAALAASREQYYLRYESQYLRELGRSLDYFVSMALTMATQEALKYTILSGIVAAIAWPAGLLSLASVIDNPWGVACRRSAQVGKQLAEVLLAREHGRRPVTLVGYSLGARVIFYCLREMAGREGCEGVVQDAYLIGAPCSGNPERWALFPRVVAGRIVNAYCKSDWLLRFLYRTLSFPVKGVAGLQPIDCTHQRIVNVDLSHIISGHSEYPEKMGLVLQELGVRVVDTGLEPPVILRTQSHQALALPPESSVMRQSQSDSALARPKDPHQPAASQPQPS